MRQMKQMKLSCVKASIYYHRWATLLFKSFTNISRKIAIFATSKRSDWCSTNGKPCSVLGETKKKNCFADIRGFYVALGGGNNNIVITYA